MMTTTTMTMMQVMKMLIVSLIQIMIISYAATDVSENEDSDEGCDIYIV